ncbi:TIGR02677 family protein [Actinomadura alba]|uniref:TIGR02677 family protein n=1 Tax=Actinomadura alba TaxID=406431 RepID=A0ABR7LPE9_9ACTN|nr:TIGR02677 family protein [Actinomadura alba]MBC6466732.1 TIGR02677 family protein [Actinomadura alba]
MADSPSRPFAHVDAPNAELYRRVMNVFTASKRRFVVHLRPEDVIGALRGDGGPAVTQEQAEDALKSLEGWGNLRADPDTSRVTTVEDFYRARFLYQLSREGEAAERALAVYEQEIGRRGELQAVALEDIRVRLRNLADQPAHPDPAVVHNLLLELIGRLDSLAANASAFMGSLQRTIDLHEIDEEAFLAYKDRLIAYLERFVSELVVKHFEIAKTLRAFPEGRVTALLMLAAEREAADAAPGEEVPPTGQRLTEWRDRWSGLGSWFLGDRVHPSQAHLLRTRARKAIPDLLATVSVLQERRAGRSDRSADFRALARWFAQAETDEDAHRLWRAAFGLTTSRHLTLDPDAAPPDAPAATSWLDAPRVEIAARLRTSGHYQRRGGASKIVDRSKQRERLAVQVAAEREQTEAAKARLATGAPTRLSELGALDRQEFGLFLRLLGDALAAGPPGPDGTITTRTGDGALEISLTPLGGFAQIVTDDGVLHGPDHEIVIVDLNAAVARR